MRPREEKNKNRQYLIWAAIFVAGLIIGFAIDRLSRLENNVNVVRENSKKYELINPFLLFDTEEKYSSYGSLNQKIKNYINESTTKYRLADSVSVYLRDMDSGHWTGINEEEKYQPGSLIKVMVMLVYLKLAEANPEVLNQYLYYEPNEKREQFYEPKTILSRGSYPVQELIKKMLVDSDNDALFALKKYPKVEDEMNNLNEILGMPPFTADDYLSPKAYSSLYRILYSGTYLSRSHSELALRLLTATNFTSGLIAGLPKDENILVAHKFGERTEFTPEGEIIKRELHDCGIIYYPPKPYFLCIMSKGRDFGDLEKVLTGISRLIYTEISAEN